MMFSPTIIIKFLTILSLITIAGASCPAGCGRSEDASCCELDSNQFACCPYANGICCSDGKHCCPQGSKCDEQSMSCAYPTGPTWPYRALFDHRTTEKENEDVTKNAFIICPDRKSICATDSTCCPISNGNWGCCRYKNGVCCTDGHHCCPSGSQCNAADGTCIETVNPLISMLGGMPKLQPSRRKPHAGAEQEQKQPDDLMAYAEVACDDSFACPKQTTCCHTNTGGWACCPIKNAVCCLDGQHCCPKDYQCDLSAGTCFRGKLDPFTSILAQPDKQPATTVLSSVCPGGLISCASGTCCLTAKGHYRCCPHTGGVCCPNSDNCCPANSVCDPDSGSCKSPTVNLFVQLLASMQHLAQPSGAEPKPDSQVPTAGQPAAAAEEKKHEQTSDVTVCPGQDFYCPKSSKCCPGVGDDKWLCCPFADAVCCSDGSHCCPANTVCSATHQGCTPVTPAEQPLAPLPTPPTAGTVSKPTGRDHVCPDGESECDDDMTCCQMVDGDWGCCPLVNAVCCHAHDHCCPSGTRCTDEDTCEHTDGRPQIFSAPHLIPPKKGGVRIKATVHDVPPPTFKFHLAQTATPASRDLMLLSPSYRQMKQLHHVICPSGVHRCLQNEKCCHSDLHGYTCIPSDSTCCSSASGTYCPSGKVCSPAGAICDRG